MSITPIMPAHLAAQQNNASFEAPNASLGLEGVIEPSASDIASFQSTVLQQAQSSGPAASSPGQFVAAAVDSIQQSRKRVAVLASNADHMSARDVLDIQSSTENFSLTTQILSKVVSAATKAIDTLVHIQ